MPFVSILENRSYASHSFDYTIIVVPYKQIWINRISFYKNSTIACEMKPLNTR